MSEVLRCAKGLAYKFFVSHVKRSIMFNLREILIYNTLPTYTQLLGPFQVLPFCRQYTERISPAVESIFKSILGELRHNIYMQSNLPVQYESRRKTT